jgi:hypothetical protein
MRWLVLGVALFIGFLYYRPLSSYLETKEERLALARRLAGAEDAASVERHARRLGLVRPGEKLFIVKGIHDWRRAKRHK